jgi:hypothetical protein
MEDLWKSMEKDYMSEDFTKTDWLVFGILAPLALVIVLAIVAILDAMLKSSLYQ